MIDTEPSVIIRDLLANQWDSSNVDGTFDTAWIGTGWWDEETPNPQITLSGMTETRDPTGIDPNGGGFTSWVDGAVDCNVWIPNDRDATGGVNPKQHRWQLDSEIQRIIRANSTGTTDSDGYPQLTRLDLGEARYFVEESDSPVVFRATVPIGYAWHARP